MSEKNVRKIDKKLKIYDNLKQNFEEIPRNL